MIFHSENEIRSKSIKDIPGCQIKFGQVLLKDRKISLPSVRYFHYTKTEVFH